MSLVALDKISTPSSSMSTPCWFPVHLRSSTTSADPVKTAAGGERVLDNPQTTSCSLTDSTLFGDDVLGSEQSFPAVSQDYVHPSRFHVSAIPCAAAPLSPRQRWRFSSDMDDPESATPAPAALYPVASSATRRAGGLRQNWTLATQYQLPGTEAYTMRGQLLRLKGRWKKRWAPEWVLVQSNILLTCTREEPYLVKLCIPLKNINAVERGSGITFELRYVEATRKDRIQAAVARFRAKDAEEADSFVSALRDHWQTAQRSATILGDFVARQSAETTIRSLYDNVKNGALRQLASRLAGIVVSNRHACLRLCLLALQDAGRRANLAARVAQSEAAAADAVAAARTARASAGAGAIALALATLFRARRHSTFLELKRRTDLRHLDALTRTTRDTLVATLATNQETLARQYLLLREQRLGTALRLSFRRVLLEAFLRLRVHSYVATTYIGLRRSALQAFVSERTAERCKFLAKGVCYWRHISQVHVLRQQSLRAFFLARFAVARSYVLHHWRTACAARVHKDYRAAQQLANVISTHTSRSLILAFSSWVRWTVSHQQAETLQLVANVSKVNDVLVDRFKDVARERTCHQLSAVLARMYRVRLQSTFRILRGAYDRYMCQRQGLTLGVALLKQMMERRLRHALFVLFQRVAHCDRRRTARLNAATKLQITLVSAQNTRLVRAFLTWKQGPGGNPLVPVFNRLSASLDRLRKRQLTISFGWLITHSHEVSLIRGLVRVQHLQRMVQYAECHRAAALATAFMRWRAVITSSSRPVPASSVTPDTDATEFITPPPLRTRTHLRRGVVSQDLKGRGTGETVLGGGRVSPKGVPNRGHGRSDGHTVSNHRRGLPGSLHIGLTRVGDRKGGPDAQHTRTRVVRSNDRPGRHAHWGSVPLTTGSSLRVASVARNDADATPPSYPAYASRSLLMTQPHQRRATTALAPYRVVSPVRRFVSLSPERRAHDDVHAIEAVLNEKPFRPKSYLALLPGQDDLSRPVAPLSSSTAVHSGYTKDSISGLQYSTGSSPSRLFRPSTGLLLSSSSWSGDVITDVRYRPGQPYSAPRTETGLSRYSVAMGGAAERVRDGTVADATSPSSPVVYGDTALGPSEFHGKLPQSRRVARGYLTHGSSSGTFQLYGDQHHRAPTVLSTQKSSTHVVITPQNALGVRSCVMQPESCSAPCSLEPRTDSVHRVVHGDTGGFPGGTTPSSHTLLDHAVYAKRTTAPPFSTSTVADNAVRQSVPRRVWRSSPSRDQLHHTTSMKGIPVTKHLVARIPHPAATTSVTH